MNRLILATGTWQIILASSAIRQETKELNFLPKDYLVLSGPRLSEEMKQTMMHIASIVWDWQSIIWADDLLHSNLPDFQADNFSPILQSFKNLIPVDNFHEIWVCKLISKAEKIVVESYPKASIVIYEDGLHSYVPYEDWNLFNYKLISKPQKIKHIIKHIVYEKLGNFESLNNSSLCRKHINRINRTYLSLTNYLPVPSYLNAYVKPIKVESINRSINIINSAINFENVLTLKSKDTNNFLVLGQCFSKWNLMSRDEEFCIYDRIFSTLAEHHFTPIWKEHPRVDRPFFKELADKYSSIEPLELNIHFSWPVELFAQQLNLMGCVSVTSTSLFYLQHFFNIPTYTIADELLEILKDDFLYMTKLVVNHITSFSKI